jgi:HlyD family secretion protein
MPGRPVRPVRRTSSGRRRIVAGAAAALVGLAAVGVGTAHALQGSGTADYRTAVVTRSSVTATLERSGTIEPVTQASVSFPMSGTVASVGVSVGQSVTTGQVLGTLNGTSLQATLTSKQATLAQAQLVVSQAETAQADAATAATAATAAAASTATASSSSKTSGQSSSAASSQTRQEATGVTSAQQLVDQDLQFANTAVQAVTQTCGSSPSSSAGATSTAAATGMATTNEATGATGMAAATKAAAATQAAAAATATSPTSTTTPTTTNAAAATATSACTAAIQSALVAQQNLASAEAALAKAEAALQSTLNQAASSATTSTTQATTAARAVSSATSSAAGQSSGGGTQSSVGATQSSTVPSAADLVADQAAVDADEAQVAVAQQNLAEATIVSPINGTIAQVGVAVGQQVSAASSTAAIVVVGQGGWEVATTVPVASIADVALGDSATVVADGQAQPLAGKVVELGVAPNSSGNYAVVVGFTTSPSGLGNGASATVTIDSAKATQALTVPTSAVHAAGGVYYVSTLANGKVTNAFVQVGVVGADRTEIKSGLQVGQVVVMADLNTALPSANTTSGRIGVATSALAGGGVVRVGSATRSLGG